MGARTPRGDRKAPAQAHRSRRPSTQSALGNRGEESHDRRPRREEVRLRPARRAERVLRMEETEGLSASRRLRLSGVQRVERPRRAASSSRTRAASSPSLFHFRRNTTFRCAPWISAAASASHTAREKGRWISEFLRKGLEAVAREARASGALERDPPRVRTRPIPRRRERDVRREGPRHEEQPRRRLRPRGRRRPPLPPAGPLRDPAPREAHAARSAEAAAAASSPSKKSLVLAGPLCTSLDILHPAARLPLPARGDLLAFENAGAYGFTESMPLFLSHEWPAEVGVREGPARAPEAASDGGIASSRAEAADLKLQRVFVRYGAALGATAVACGLRLALAPFLGSRLAFVTFIAACLFAAWYGGIGPGVLSSILGGALAVWLFQHPARPDPDLFFSLGGYAFICLVCIGFVEWSRRNHERFARSEALEPDVPGSVSRGAQGARGSASGASRRARHRESQEERVPRGSRARAPEPAGSREQCDRGSRARSGRAHARADARRAPASVLSSRARRGRSHRRLADRAGEGGSQDGGRGFRRARAPCHRGLRERVHRRAPFAFGESSRSLPSGSGEMRTVSSRSC